MADIQTLKQLLNNYSYKLSEENVDRLISLMEEVHYKSYESIVKEGEINDNLYVVKDGIIRAFHTRTKNEITLYFGTEGDIFFAASCFYRGIPSLVVIESCGESTLMKISRKDFMDLCYQSLEFANWALDISIGQFWSFEIKGTLIAGDAYERYNTLVKKRPQIIQNVPLKTIASYLGITKQSLSRLRNPMYRSNKKSSSEDK